MSPSALQEGVSPGGEVPFLVACALPSRQGRTWKRNRALSATHGAPAPPRGHTENRDRDVLALTTQPEALVLRGVTQRSPVRRILSPKRPSLRVLHNALIPGIIPLNARPMPSMGLLIQPCFVLNGASGIGETEEPSQGSHAEGHISCPQFAAIGYRQRFYIWSLQPSRDSSLQRQVPHSGVLEPALLNLKWWAWPKLHPVAAPEVDSQPRFCPYLAEKTPLRL